MRLILPISLAGLALTFLVAAAPSHGDEPKTEDAATDNHPVSFWMEKKLDYSQAILRGLAQADFKEITQNAERMRLLSKVEGFVRRKDPDYGTHLHSFERICSEIVRQGNRENLEGVALAFNQLTVSCVSCHQMLREQSETASLRQLRDRSVAQHKK